jgi:transposase
MSQERIQVITGVERRRRFTAEQKMRLCEECDRPGMTVSYVARTHGIAPSQLFHWRRRMAEGSREAVEADDEVVSAAKVRELEKQVRELQRVLGKKTMENEILREAVRLAHEKNSSCDCRRCPRTIPREGDRRHARSLAIEFDRSKL